METKEQLQKTEEDLRIEIEKGLVRKNNQNVNTVGIIPEAVLLSCVNKIYLMEKQILYIVFRYHIMNCPKHKSITDI